MNKKFFSLCLSLAVLLSAVGLVSYKSYAFEKSIKIDFTVKKENKPVLNPHKGWVQYIYDPKYFDDTVYGVGNEHSWDMTAVVYSRFNWCDIETEEGKYDWSAIDEMIELSEKYGKTFAFGIIPADSGCGRSEGLVPEYVYSSGCKYVIAAASSSYAADAYQRTPVWSDGIYHKAAIKLAEAIADKYDGDSRIEYIDIRSLGNWGEWHTYGLDGSIMPSENVQKQYIKEWSEIFDETQLVLPVNDDKPNAVSKYAVKQGVALRRDGLVGLENHEMALTPAYENKLPAVGELCYGYVDMRDDGTWADSKLSTAVRRGRVTYMALGGSIFDGSAMYSERRELVESLQNEIGYNFVVTSAGVEFEGDNAEITIKIENDGIAPQYFPVTVILAVTDKKGNNAEKLPVSFSYDSGTFTSGSVKTLRCTVAAETLKSGKYLSAGIFENVENDVPEIRFCNKNTAENNYLVLGKIAL